jgi:hypothetical protein
MGALHDKMNSSERENEPKALGKKKCPKLEFFFSIMKYIYFFSKLALIISTFLVIMSRGGYY